jgi:hypothetical protein
MDNSGKTAEELHENSGCFPLFRQISSPIFSFMM